MARRRAPRRTTRRATRRNPDLVDDVVGPALQVGILAVGGLVAFKVLPGAIQNILHPGSGGSGSTADPAGSSAGHGGTSATSAASGGVTAAGTGGQPTCQGVAIASMAGGGAMAQLAVEWRAARWAAYQDPDDWNAFSQHARALAPSFVSSYPNVLACPWQGWPDAFGGSFAPPVGQVGHRA